MSAASKFRTPGVCNLCKQPLADTWSFYCKTCNPVAEIVYTSVDEAVRYYIPKATRDTCTRALDLEVGKPFLSRKTIITALHRRLRKLDRGGAS